LFPRTCTCTSARGVWPPILARVRQIALTRARRARARDRVLNDARSRCRPHSVSETRTRAHEAESVLCCVRGQTPPGTDGLSCDVRGNGDDDDDDDDDRVCRMRYRFHSHDKADDAWRAAGFLGRGPRLWGRRCAAAAHRSAGESRRRRVTGVAARWKAGQCVYVTIVVG
jgi:hypothetical protein